MLTSINPFRALNRAYASDPKCVLITLICACGKGLDRDCIGCIRYLSWFLCLFGTLLPSFHIWFDQLDYNGIWYVVWIWQHWLFYYFHIDKVFESIIVDGYGPRYSMNVTKFSNMFNKCIGKLISVEIILHYHSFSKHTLQFAWNWFLVFQF